MPLPVSFNTQLGRNAAFLSQARSHCVSAFDVAFVAAQKEEAAQRNGLPHDQPVPEFDLTACLRLQTKVIHTVLTAGGFSFPQRGIAADFDQSRITIAGYKQEDRPDPLYQAEFRALHSDTAYVNAHRPR